jgi:hypothetical protein
MKAESERLSVVLPEGISEPKDLPGDLEIIAEVIGVGSTIALAREFGGCKLYIANIDTVRRKSKEQVEHE